MYTSIVLNFHFSLFIKSRVFFTTVIGRNHNHPKYPGFWEWVQAASTTRISEQSGNRAWEILKSFYNKLHLRSKQHLGFWMAVTADELTWDWESGRWELPTLIWAIGPASWSAREKSSGETTRATSVSGPWPAASSGLPSCRTTSGIDVLFTTCPYKNKWINDVHLNKHKSTKKIH